MDIKEVLALKKQLEDEYRKDREAIDRVLVLLTKRGSDVQRPASRKAITKKQVNRSLRSNALVRSHEASQTLLLTGENGTNGDVGKKKVPFGRERDSGIRGAAKQAIHYVPLTFGRKDLIAAIEEHSPEWRGKTTKDAMKGAVKRLLEDGLMEVVSPSAGKQPAVYRKLV
jgi:hypothetical protein